MSDAIPADVTAVQTRSGRGARLRLAVTGLLLAVAALLTPLGLANLHVGDPPPGDTSAEAGFARDMQTHHAQAVDLSMLAWQRSTDPRIRTLAYDIALTQQTQIGTMRQWLHQWGLAPTSTAAPMTWMADDPAMTMTVTADGLMPGMATETDQLLASTGRDFDALYCRLMTRHHLGGIMMVDGLLHLSHAGEVAALAQAMKTGQQSEITAFQEILAGDNAAP